MTRPRFVRLKSSYSKSEEKFEKLENVIIRNMKFYVVHFENLVS